MKGETLSNKLAKDTSTTSFYPTPPEVTEAILRFLNLPKQIMIWEPACGDGKMVDVFQQHGHEVMATDLYDYGNNISGIDFLQQNQHLTHWIITNPPFHIADDFIKHCMRWEKPFALLLKSQFWHAKKRRELFMKRRPEFVLPLTWRPDFLFGSKSGSPTMECCWTVWGPNSASKTEYFPLLRPGPKR